MTVNDDSAIKLAAQLAISSQAIEEAIRRGLLSFAKHRRLLCWRFGDSRNGSFRRLDGEPFRINGKYVKAEAETRGESWHRMIGLADVVANDRSEILLTPEGSKDALAALHFADAEGRLPDVGLVAALGSAVKLLPDDLEKFRGRRIRIFPDVDGPGRDSGARIGQAIASIAAETQIFDLAGLQRDDGAAVKDLFDLTRIGYAGFEENRDLWSITDLDSKGERLRIVTSLHEEKKTFLNEVFSSPAPLPHESPEFHVYPVSHVSSSQELEQKLQQLAVINACQAPSTARKKRWKFVRDLGAVQKRLSRKLTPSDRMKAFDEWYRVSVPHLDPNKTRDWYRAACFAEFGKVLVPTGEGAALKNALQRMSRLSVSELPELPSMADAPESWRRLAALHRELARLSADGTYFLGCRDAAKADPSLNKDSANNVNCVLNSFAVIKLIQLGEAKPGGDASIFRYLLPL